MSYRTSKTTPIPPPTLPGLWKVYYPYMTPDGIEVIVGARTGVRDNYIHHCNGSWDGTRQSCHYFYSKGAVQFSDDDTVIVSHWADVGGVPTEVLRMSVQGYDAVNKYLVFNVEKVTTDYQINIRARG